MQNTKEIFLTEDARQLISSLRTEVARQKDCITSYTVMSIAFVGGVWGLVSKIDGFNLPFYFCSALLVFMLTVVVRLSNHKYATINRQLGYELHLNRLGDYSRVGNFEWAKRMMLVNWEEAMCAWRFVQPAIFNRVYETSDGPNDEADEADGFYEIFEPYTRKKDQCDLQRPVKKTVKIDGVLSTKDESEDVYYWYETEALIAKGASYHQGKYLQNIHRFLNAVSGFTLASIWGLLAYQVLVFILTECLSVVRFSTQSWLSIIQFLIAAVMNLIKTRYTWSQIRRQSGYRQILEGGMLSIQSCAVVWRIVTTCHILGSSWPLNRGNGYSSQHAAAKHINALIKKGHLVAEEGKARALRLVQSFPGVRRPETAEIPLFGSIPAGFSEDREQEPDGFVSVDVATIGFKPTRNSFALRVKGDSMIGKHICDGDVVILEHGQEPGHGDIVAALIDRESTLKTFMQRGGKTFLRAENPRYPDLIPASELVIQGVMVALIRKQKKSI